MNWSNLTVEELHEAAVSKKLTVKEASDAVSLIWYYLKPMPGFPPAPREYVEKYMDLTIALCKVADNNWQKRWENSIPTDMKAIEILKKILQERGIKTS
jgi:hypothetical protein